jgi:hypothetical protein
MESIVLAMNRSQMQKSWKRTAIKTATKPLDRILGREVADFRSSSVHSMAVWWLFSLATD